MGGSYRISESGLKSDVSYSSHFSSNVGRKFRHLKYFSVNPTGQNATMFDRSATWLVFIILIGFCSTLTNIFFLSGTTSLVVSKLFMNDKFG